ncbi:enoyl-CoA hydratase/isomerase family protein [Nocardia sp. BSTN01]|uniref:enoyl-CoA hydratase-related protein n=1 Tax=Nocardia sp. BSTN01 TaxID=2783665 RepID=UPI00188F9421|nr:enoyl-CoA hydratase-related protein [Nocardia sp. BSTN01]MBF4997289.1 enoyl-CoA hydratase/isomerase family protein [Nocardia sp. BSTN01]
MTDRVQCVVEGGVADVRLNRPEKINALDDEMFDALLRTAVSLRGRADVRAVVLSGNGRGFCAGLDLEAFRAMAGGQAFRPADADERAATIDVGGDPELSRGQRTVMAFRQLPVPVIAAVHGAALGGGLQLALGAHIRIVAPDVSLGLLEMRWGITPDMCGTQLLPSLIGQERALEMILAARVLDGAEAVRIGLASAVSDEPLRTARALADLVAQRNPDAVRALLGMVGIGSFTEALAAERAAMRSIVGSPAQRAAAAANLGR